MFRKLRISLEDFRKVQGIFEKNQRDLRKIRETFKKLMELPKSKKNVKKLNELPTSTGIFQ